VRLNHFIPQLFQAMRGLGAGGPDQIHHLPENAHWPIFPLAFALGLLYHAAESDLELVLVDDSIKHEGAQKILGVFAHKVPGRFQVLQIEALSSQTRPNWLVVRLRQDQEDCFNSPYAGAREQADRFCQLCVIGVGIHDMSTRLRVGEYFDTGGVHAPGRFPKSLVRFREKIS